MSNQPLTQIDIDALLKQRLPKHYRYIPSFVISRLARIIHQNELNAILREMAAQPGAVEAADAALRILNVHAEVMGKDNIPDQGRFIFVSNHPLGGLDGLVLISCIGHLYDGNIRFMVNDLLMQVKPLQPIFLPVNKYGTQSRRLATEIEAQYKGENQMITFPAGLCSRMNDDGKIRDLQWKKFIITHAIRNRRDIIPIYFEGENSKSFYRKAKWRKKLGIKFNYEMILLPGEMFKSKGKTFKIHVGKPIEWSSLNPTQPQAEAQRACNVVYSITLQNNA